MSAGLDMARLAVSQLSRKDRAELLRELAPAKGQSVATDNACKVISRKSTAELLNRSTRAVDRLAQEGHLQRIVLPNRKRGAGFRLADIQRLCGGK